MADYPERIASYERAITYAASTGIHALDVPLHSQGVYLALKAGDLPRAERILATVEKMLTRERQLDVAHFTFLRSAAAFDRGDIPLASEYAFESLRIADRCGATLGVLFSRIVIAHIHWRMGRAGEALTEADEVIRAGREQGATPPEFVGYLLRAYFLLGGDQPAEGLSALRTALSFGRRHALRTPTPWCDRRVAQRLCEVALSHDIEASFVREIIQCLGLRPRDLTVVSWPWPIRVFALGRLTVWRGEAAISLAGKAQKKPLALLKAIIAQGERPIDIGSLMTAVWSAEGAGARSAFDIALLRLRRLLGVPDAVELASGRLTLNPQVCWVDAWAFERAVEQKRGSESNPLYTKLLDLYRGPFLDDEVQTPSVATARDRLASKYQRAILRAGEEQQLAGNWDVAAESYRRGLEQDNLAEELYRRLMLCEWRLGHRADALRTYRRCRDLLSIVLSTKPCAETEAAYRQIMTE